MNAAPEILPTASAASPAAEPVRLVIWDLDETFWHGTLSEGGARWRPEAQRAVVQLARRGIISSICSKNDIAPVERILAQRGMREYFFLPSISWESKGPRLARLVEQSQLRAPSVLFIDDNPMNRAEALHFVPGIQVADETLVPALLDDPRLRGKPDPQLTRLKQYQLLERRAVDMQSAAGDTEGFLRASGITVAIEHDVDPHLDRAIELINRTNQLNFTKRRLPEDMQQARAQLRALLAEHTIQAGLLRVHDDYGDYGFCGLYVMRSQRNVGRVLLHYAFSCRILGMGIETWLFALLERPTLKVSGAVLTDVLNDHRTIDWVRIVPPGAAAAADTAPRFSYLLARGACDLRAVSHYFRALTPCVIEEFDGVRNGQLPMSNHSVLAAQAIAGFPAAAIADFAPLGYVAADFAPFAAGDPPAGPGVWLLSFSIELGVPLWRHRATGALLPAVLPGLHGPAKRVMDAAVTDTGVDPAVVAHLRERFDYIGPIADTDFQRNVRTLLGRAAPDTRVFIILGNDEQANVQGCLKPVAGMRRWNELIAAVASEFANVALIRPRDVMSEAELLALKTPHHYDRMVYFRTYEHIVRQLER